MLKRLAVLLLNFCAIFSLSACRQTENSLTEVWTTAGSSICAWFDEAGSPDSMGVNVDPSILRVGKTSDGKDIFSFLRLPLRGTFFADEIESARLYMKLAEGEVPDTLGIALLRDLWSNSITALADARNISGREDAVSVAVRREEDGWISLDITGCVKGWLNADMPNYGIAISGETDGEETVFFSDWDESSPNPPRLEVTGLIGSRDLSYGKFGYIRHPENEQDDSSLELGEVANCLSYALRDINMITADDLGLDYVLMTDTYRESGLDAVADYCAGRVTDYIEQHQDALKISSFRQIDNFDSEIDPKKEYRVAFRVGGELYGEDDFFDEVEGNFDYHVWAQINTGQWAQKFLFDPTEIVPHIPPGVSPGKYPWDASFRWGSDKTDAFYGSKVIYFAVTKEAEGFTEHKSTDSPT